MKKQTLEKQLIGDYQHLILRYSDDKSRISHLMGIEDYKHLDENAIREILHLGFLLNSKSEGNISGL
jgi:hypothetical protein